MKKSATLLLVASWAALLGGAAQAPLAVQELPNLVWERTFRSDVFEYELKATAAAADSLWAVVGVRPWGDRVGRPKHELWRLDEKGERLQIVDLSNVSIPSKPPEQYSDFHGLAALQNGDAAVVLGRGASPFYLVIDRAGKVWVNRAAPLTRFDNFVARLRASGTSALVVGRVGNLGWLLKLGPAGQVLAELRVRDVADLRDAIEMADGYVALGESVDAKGGNTVWVGRINSKGDVVASMHVAGVSPSLSRSARGAGFILVYETALLSDGHVVVQGFTDALAPEWTGGPTDIVRGMRPFNAEPVATSEFLLVGEGPAQGLWILRMGQGGPPSWTYEAQEPGAMQTLLWNSTLTRWGNDYVVGATLAVAQRNTKGGFEQRYIVTLKRLGSF